MRYNLINFGLFINFSLKIVVNIIQLLNNLYEIVKVMVDNAIKLKDIPLSRLNVMINAATEILQNKINDADLKDGVVNLYSTTKLR